MFDYLEAGIRALLMELFARLVGEVDREQLRSSKRLSERRRRGAS
ncbi:MAG TPA: hypothetical protein VGL47_08175 [Amycolatopsis sp.]|uniref:Uncharacterized protein n=1 Tax=Amycolatopsis nalaikhensis TaxID=715472 RepID=A0ABY8XL32_9PSEU|nr:hypothetical protein [Amycolatopsis sp. 2-2]WIV56345.1 hypothetical protein QP939_47395 [Amycolatopsis sp. 2-2]